jgi:hypothetical protein
MMNNQEAKKFLEEAFEELEACAMLHATVEHYHCEVFRVTFNGMVTFKPGVWAAAQKLNRVLAKENFTLADIRHVTNEQGDTATIFRVE